MSFEEFERSFKWSLKDQFEPYKLRLVRAKYFNSGLCLADLAKPLFDKAGLLHLCSYLFKNQVSQYHPYHYELYFLLSVWKWEFSITFYWLHRNHNKDEFKKGVDAERAKEKDTND